MRTLSLQLRAYHDSYNITNSAKALTSSGDSLIDTALLDQLA